MVPYHSTIWIFPSYIITIQGRDGMHFGCKVLSSLAALSILPNDLNILYTMYHAMST